jgi:hypothetical protein
MWTKEIMCFIHVHSQHVLQLSCDLGLVLKLPLFIVFSKIPKEKSLIPQKCMTTFLSITNVNKENKFRLSSLDRVNRFYLNNTELITRFSVILIYKNFTYMYLYQSAHGLKKKIQVHVLIISTSLIHCPLYHRYILT